MSPRYTLMAVAVMSTAPARFLISQGTAPGTLSPLELCTAAADRNDFVRAARLADAADAPLRATLTTKPDDAEALVMLARVISQCRIPGAELMQQGALSAEAVELLARALDLRPRDWLARYLLALHHFRAPSFMNRSAAAAREFDVLLAQQGEATSPGIFARPFEYRGLLWLRANERDSARTVWTHGLRLFPSDSALQERIRGLVGSELARHSQRSAVTPSALQPVVVRVAASVRGAREEQRVVQRTDVLMSPGATADVLQAIQLQGGATLTGDAADLHARGGDAAETALLVNGSRMIGAVRFESLDGSLFSALDPQVLSSTRFSPGGFSVRVGNALSGVIEAETDGRPRESQQRIGVSIVSASSTKRVPLGARAGAWGSIRASHTAPMLWINGRSGEYSNPPWSLDAVGGLTIMPDRRSEVRAVAMFSMDDVTRRVTRGDYQGGYRAGGEFAALSVDIRRVSADAPVVTRFALAGSGRRSTQQFGVLDRARAEGMAIIRGDVEWQATALLRIRSGVDGSLFARDERGTVPVSEALSPGSPVRALNDETRTTGHAGLWAEGEWQLASVAIIAGLRADRLPDQSDLSLDPRLNVSFDAGGVRLHGAVGVFHQGAWRPTPDLTSPGLLADFATLATHYVAGIEGKGAWEWRLESFLKQYRDYVARGDLRAVRGGVTGLEAVLRRLAVNGRRLDGWAVYALTRSRVTLADGQDIPGAFDVTHALTAVTTWRPNDQWRVGVTNRVATGMPFTDIVSSTPASGGGWVPAYGPPNAARLPTYARTDVRLTRLVSTSRGLGVMFVETINLFDRRNVVTWAYDSTWRHRTPVTQFFGRRTVVVGVELQR